MNSQVDVIVIGDSYDGYDAVKKIASSNPAIKMVFVSKNFRSVTTRDYLNVEYIKDEVVFTDYKNRLFGVYLKNGARLYCTHLIIASGLSYALLLAGHRQIPNVFNNVNDIPKHAKNQPAIVIGNTNNDVKFALAVAKKYKQVYLCTQSMSIEGLTESNKNKLAKASNIVVLPNTSITKFQAPDGVLKTVELDNYSTVTCSAVFAKTQAKPETNFVSNIIGKDSLGYLITTRAAQSILVPKCFAIGTCAIKSTQKMKAEMISLILKDFNGGNLK